ncbi:hypothetical protein V0R50_09105 [Pseudomonas sp. 148P]|uniref:Imidazoleglycerol-phosphate synthase n=1 Tax=Pseudomonas ulcerans TaxID=3115852 RepID=A0ABU7HPD5_9PSED|nr:MULTISPECIES: hypothetical protein [unclassified Pseudomonas]MEE1920598.1 hypothetical protein [Pseudomonas sp. 147P]MEE1933380.1 hypothetical protein [Pseudomonas sp. 148P]
MSDAYAELIEWLQEASRTYGWGALLAWDRSKVNSLLLQQYIAAFDSGHYLPAFTDLIVTSTLTAEYIHDYTLDYPRLSFETATVLDPKARLRMQVIGGLQLSLQHLGGDSSRIYQIAAVDVLDGRSLYMNLALMQTPGSTGSAGKVVLNLVKGGEFELTFARSEQERWLGGDYFRQQFELLDDDQKILVLGELGAPDGQVLEPASFYISTHGKADEPEQGAVLFFIRMKDDGNGGLPPTDGDLHYLLEGGYSCAMLLGRDYLMRRLFIPACERFVGWLGFFAAAPNENEPQGPTHYLRAAVGFLQIYRFSQGSAFFREVSLPTIELPLKAAECSFHLSFTSQVIQLHWRGIHHEDAFLLTHDDRNTSVQARIQFEVKRNLRVDLEGSDGRLSFPQVHIGTLSDCEVTLTSDGTIPGAMNKFRLEVSRFLQQELMAHVETGFQRFLDTLVDIDLDQLTGLLFHRREDLRFETAGCPRDLVLFGKMQPFSQSFHVRPMELVMGPSETQWFSTWPTRVPRWSVESLSGQGGPVGSINGFGFYTAPETDQLPRGGLRVKVTATFDDYASSALVTVLPGDITVNPLVMVHTAGALDDGREMSAGTRGGGQLIWEMSLNSGGRIEPSSEPDGDHTYFPGPVQPDLVYSIDEVRVTNLATSRIQTAYVLLLHQALVVVVTARRATGDTVQLRAFLQGEEHPEMAREWAVLLGGGSVDPASGVFTPDDSPHRFAIVTVRLDTGFNFWLDGFILLPLPFIELPAWGDPPGARPAHRW